MSNAGAKIGCDICDTEGPVEPWVVDSLARAAVDAHMILHRGSLDAAALWMLPLAHFVGWIAGRRQRRERRA